MALEVERKFLVTGDAWRAGARGTLFRQGYLCNARARSVRVRVSDTEAWLTVKGETMGMVRPEFEYRIPFADADALLELCLQPLIEKTRYRIEYAGQLWEVDEFAAENAGLVLAEIELQEAGQQIDLPVWVGEEVTEDPRYYNANLQLYPYRQWSAGAGPV
jgi:adenylate cyclase